MTQGIAPCYCTTYIVLYLHLTPQHEFCLLDLCVCLVMQDFKRTNHSWAKTLGSRRFYRDFGNQLLTEITHYVDGRI